MLKKIFVSVAIIIAISLLAILFFFGESFSHILTHDRAYLTVKEEKGIDAVYIDNTFKGNTPLLNLTLDTGTHTVSIENNANKNSYTIFSKSLTFEKNTNSVITISLGPSDRYTAYNIFSFTLGSSINTGLIVTDDTDTNSQMSVQLDTGATITPGTLYVLDPKTYTISYHKEGYVDQKTEITITKDQIVENIVHLARKPI